MFDRFDELLSTDFTMSCSIVCILNLEMTLNHRLRQFRVLTNDNRSFFLSEISLPPSDAAFLCLFMNQMQVADTKSRNLSRTFLNKPFWSFFFVCFVFDACTFDETV